jgi:hypothetical protein
MSQKVNPIEVYVYHTYICNDTACKLLAKNIKHYRIFVFNVMVELKETLTERGYVSSLRGAAAFLQLRQLITV